MNDIHLDFLSRRMAQATSRRGSLLAIGGGGMAALAGLSLDAAGKKGKNRRKKNRNKNNGDERCQEQVAQCNAVFVDLCAETTDPAACLQQTGVCCDFLGECEADEFLTCFLTLLA